ncbi:unnamed protein product [Notodromas monacha]|uniref:Uncharacterized protein n=1 Tax=Notodromas monacha TaxID=399045 RepID=A0A7R9GBP2_9CRUS|nr:unnamed protein product [Notodromas monacha]CAG0915263.1 unnamed protein product [Notodromas monacha]
MVDHWPIRVNRVEEWEQGRGTSICVFVVLFFVAAVLVACLRVEQATSPLMERLSVKLGWRGVRVKRVPDMSLLQWRIFLSAFPSGSPSDLSNPIPKIVDFVNIYFYTEHSQRTPPIVLITVFVSAVDWIKPVYGSVRRVARYGDDALAVSRENREPLLFDDKTRSLVMVYVLPCSFTAAAALHDIIQCRTLWLSGRVVRAMNPPPEPNPHGAVFPVARPGSSKHQEGMAPGGGVTLAVPTPTSLIPNQTVIPNTGLFLTVPTHHTRRRHSWICSEPSGTSSLSQQFSLLLWVAAIISPRVDSAGEQPA